MLPAPRSERKRKIARPDPPIHTHWMRVGAPEFQAIRPPGAQKKGRSLGTPSLLRESYAVSRVPFVKLPCRFVCKSKAES